MNPVRLLAVLVPALFTPRIGLAQLVPGTPYVRTYSPITYTPCANPTVLSTNVDDSYYPVNIPFQFKFYDDFQTSVSIGTNGAIAFPSGTPVYLSNEVPGTATGLNNYIAPAWDDLRLYMENSGLIGWEVSGTAPNRTFTICYEDFSRYSYNTFVFSFQVRLFEGPAGRIEIDYGPQTGTAVFSATMAMEDAMGARPILFAASNCTSDCTLTDLAALANTRITIVQDPGVEIVASSIVAPEIAFLGAETPIQVEVINLNANPVGPFTLTVESGDGPDVQNPVTIGSEVVTLPGFSARTITVDTVFPSSIGERTVYVAAIADSAGVVNEVDETNNRAISTRGVRLLRGKPDLAIESVTTTDASPIESGGTVTVYTTVRNVGGEPAPATEVAVILSSNPVASPQDVELGRFTVSLAPGQSITSTNTVTLPAATNSGVYYLGAYADPENQLEELSESNNGRTYGTAIVVLGGELAIITPELPNGYVGETYVALLSAVGGDGTYRWSVVQGSLPDGIGLVPGTGELFGRPQTAEIQNVRIRVESNGASAERDYMLTVVDPDEPLTIVNRALASGVVGQEYSFTLVATGGSGGALSWTAEGLPEGLAFADGAISGTPAIAGEFTVSLTVTNGTESASRTLPLVVRENANLLIVPMVLSTARYGEPYDVQLVATGGVPPINWLREPVGDLPEGVDLTIEGKLTGTPMEVGTFRFLVRARDSATGALNATDVNSFELVVLDAPGFSITTTSLPDAVIGAPYDVTIAAEGGQQPYEWSVIEGRIPDGLVPSAIASTGELRILGTPEKVGVSNILVEVLDAKRRRAIRALAIRVTEPIQTTGEDDGGCGCASTARSDRALGSLWLLALIATAVPARRLVRSRVARSNRSRKAA